MKPPTLVRRLFFVILILGLAGRAETAAAQECEGFPWTVSATPVGGSTIAVTVCGTYAGCRPRNPQFSVAGSQIRITLDRSEPPYCICLAVVGTFQETALVTSVEPGDYTITVTTLNCEGPLLVSSTNFTFGAASAIPALDPWTAAALALLLAAVAVWRLRS